MMSTPRDPDAPGAPKHEMLAELVGLHARALLRMPWVQTFLVMGIGLVIFTYVQPWIFIGWGILTICVEVLRSRYAARVLRGRTEEPGGSGFIVPGSIAAAPSASGPSASSPSASASIALGPIVPASSAGRPITPPPLALGPIDSDPKRVHGNFVVLAALSGAVIGFGAVMFLPRLPILHQALLGAILLTIPAAGVAVAQSSRYMLVTYAICILLPASLTWGVLHPSQFLGVIALTSLLCVVLVLVAADGDKLLLRSVLIRHERDRLVRDLEQRNADVRAAMELAEQSAQARARVLAAASHDLRQPLHALSVYSAVLAAHPAPDTLSEVSQNIDQIVRTLGNLLNGLLDLSRLSAGYYIPERQGINLDRLAAGICAEYAGAAAHKGLIVTQAFEPIYLVGDPVAVGRIVRNLVDNAIKYTDTGEIHVATQRQENEHGAVAVISVADTGKGIPPAEQRRIFEEFYQLDNPGRDRGKGVGLGLAIVQRLCELIGAAVTVESAVGAGTCFRLTLPIVVPQTPSRADEATPALQSSLAGKRVYVVDDERDILTSMRTLLKVWGIDVATAESPDAAYQVFQQDGAPDLMIVDLRLGEEQHGADLASKLQETYGDFPILIITGETSSEALLRANEYNYTLLQKPIAAEVLRDAMVAALTAA